MENLKWMFDATCTFGDEKFIFNGFLLLDEMSIQEDLAVIKKVIGN